MTRDLARYSIEFQRKPIGEWFQALREKEKATETPRVVAQSVVRPRCRDPGFPSQDAEMPTSASE